MRTDEFKSTRGTDRFHLIEVSEIVGLAQQHRSLLSRNGAYWTGNDDTWAGGSYDEFLRCADLGDNGRVARSEEMLSKIEDQVPVSRGWRNIDDVVGALPVIPAFLAGHPQNMRRRVRVARENAPLAIYMDLGSSNTIGSREIENRGIALLAMVRNLVEHRPVELWVGASTGYVGFSSTVAWRLDTAPLDLARAAYHIAATQMSRRFAFGLSVALDYQPKGTRWNGAFAYGSHSAQVASFDERMSRMFPGMEILVIPPIFYSDPMVTDPIGWVKKTLAKYVGGDA